MSAFKSVFPEIVAQQLAEARRKHADINSAHEAYAVILEELGEFWEQVKLKREKRNPGLMCVELAQAAAMCQRAAEDLRLLNVDDYDAAEDMT